MVSQSFSFKQIKFSDVSAFLFACVIAQLPFFHLYISLTIVAWGLFSLLAIIIEKHQPTFSKNLVLFLAFYALYGIGIFWSDDKGAAGFEMEQKMSMAIVPAFFFFLRYSLKQIKLIIYLFLIAALSSMFYHMGIAFLLWTETGELDGFFYVKLTKTLHPAYMTYLMTAVLSVLLIDLWLRKLNLFKRERYYYLLFGTLSVFSLFLLSKNGLITVLVLTIALLVYLWKKKRKKLVLLLLLGSFLSTLTLYQSSGYVQARVNTTLHGLRPNATHSKAHLYSTALRRVIWGHSVNLIAESPFIGYGTGDVQIQLDALYKKHNVEQALERRLNAHNQFFQTGMAVGILGILLLLGMLYFPIRYMKRDHFYLGSFCLMSLLFFLTESVLQTQAGVIAFVFFYLLFNELSQLLKKDETAHPNSVLSA